MASRLLVLVPVALGAPHVASIAVGVVVAVFAVLLVVLVAVGGWVGVVVREGPQIDGFLSTLDRSKPLLHPIWTWRCLIFLVWCDLCPPAHHIRTGSPSAFFPCI